MSKFTVTSFREAKEKGRKITMLTAYDCMMAELLDQEGIDCLLVGDSLGMVFQGKENTLAVTVEEMIYHCKAVARGVREAIIVGDMPFLSYHISPAEAVYNAGRLIKEGGVHGVKLEGGREISQQIEAIVAAKIPVMGHLGLTPQSVYQMGGFKVQGKQLESARRILEDARALEALGVFAIVLEGIPEALARKITKSLSIPTIGIGAGNGCDGQVLVINDLLGITPEPMAKFVKKYADLRENISKAVKAYKVEVQSGVFPSEAHSFKMDETLLTALTGEDEK